EVDTSNLPSKSASTSSSPSLKDAAKGAASQAADDVTPDRAPRSARSSSTDETTHGTPKGALPENDLAQQDDYPIDPNDHKGNLDRSKDSHRPNDPPPDFNQF
ncbi:hypothetical protein SAMN05216342_3101, partial [Exiguobacterium indicum]